MPTHYRVEAQPGYEEPQCSLKSKGQRTILGAHYRKDLWSIVPNEILSHIFILGQTSTPPVPRLTDDDADDDDDNDDDAARSLPFEILVSQISSRWRNVALNTHSLWRSIDVVPERTLDEIQAYLERSRPGPIDLRFDTRCWGELKVPAAIVDLVTASIMAWRRAVINVPLDRAYHSLLRSLATYTSSATHIEHLSLCVDGVGIPHTYRLCATEFTQLFKAGAPQLKFVRLRGLAPYFFRPPLTAVTTLHIELTKAIPFSYNTMKDILTASPVLTNLSLYGDLIHFPTWPPQGIATIDLSTLQSLRLWGTHGWVFSSILIHFAAPLLRSLYLQGVHEHDLDAFWAFSMQASDRCFPMLDTLTFCDFEFSDSSYRRAHAAFPNITRFNLLHILSGTPTIVKLLGSRSHPQIWPKLHTLTLLFHPTDERRLYDALVTRASANAPLAKLRLGTRSPLSELHWITELREDLEIETFHEVDQWPGGLGYTDTGDDLFYD